MIKKLYEYFCSYSGKDVKKLSVSNSNSIFFQVIFLILVIVFIYLQKTFEFKLHLAPILFQMIIIFSSCIFGLYKKNDYNFQLIGTEVNITTALISFVLWIPNLDFYHIMVLLLIISALIINQGKLLTLLTLMIVTTTMLLIIDLIAGIENDEISNVVVIIGYVSIAGMIIYNLSSATYNIIGFVKKEAEDARVNIDKQENLLNEIIYTLESITLNYESDGTGNHNMRLKMYATSLSQLLNLDNKIIDSIRIGAPLHDIGKIMIDQKILVKESKLDKDERKYMETHVIKGYDVIQKLNLDSIVGNIIKYHHEKWDGTGYPDKLSGENIPLEARILSICDVYDALRSKRSYKKSWTHKEAIEQILSLSGVDFDPELVNIFTKNDSIFNQIFNDNK